MNDLNLQAFNDANEYYRNLDIQDLADCGEVAEKIERVQLLHMLRKVAELI